MKCRKCGKEIGENLKFCKYCGFPTDQGKNQQKKTDICPSCGAAVPPNALFCTRCGTPIQNRISRKKERKSPKKTGKTAMAKGIIALLIVASVCLIGVLVYMLLESGVLFSGKDHKEQDAVSYVSEADTSAVSNADSTDHAASSSFDQPQGSSAGIASSVFGTIPNNDPFLSINVHETQQVVKGNTEVAKKTEEIAKQSNQIIENARQGAYKKTMLDTGESVYHDDQQIVGIMVPYRNGYKGFHLLVNGHVIYAEYEGSQVNRFYFDQDKIIRWEEYKDPSQKNRPDQAIISDIDLYDKYTAMWDGNIHVTSEQVYQQWAGILTKEQVNTFNNIPQSGNVAAPEVGSYGEFILPESGDRFILPEEYEKLSRLETRVAINEIYARHGRRFKDPKWQAYFDSKQWYHGSIDPENFSDQLLGTAEMENIDALADWEKENGWR